MQASIGWLSRLSLPSVTSPGSLRARQFGELPGYRSNRGNPGAALAFFFTAVEWTGDHSTTPNSTGWLVPSPALQDRWCASGRGIRARRPYLRAFGS